MMKTIIPVDLHNRLAAGRPGLLLDVRTPCEFAALLAQGVILEPLESLRPRRVLDLLRDKPQPVYVFCQRGSRARQAVEQLEKAGVPDCVLVEGGTLAWEAAGLPVERGTSTVISLERQVRIAAGALVLTGVLLGVYCHPVFLGLSGFVGAGLIFAGMTDRCGMALLLARAPWNRVESAGCSNPKTA
jgi:rhodanese-related sulfurtransferase